MASDSNKCIYIYLIVNLLKHEQGPMFNCMESNANRYLIVDLLRHVYIINYKDQET